MCDLWLIYLSPLLGPRLLRSLHLGLPFLWVPDALQHGGGPGLMRRMHIRGLLLLLLHRRSGRRLQLPLWHGLWHNGCLLRVLRLPGNLHGVLRHLLPHIDRPVLVWTRAISKTPKVLEGSCCCYFRILQRIEEKVCTVVGICFREGPIFCVPDFSVCAN